MTGQILLRYISEISWQFFILFLDFYSQLVKLYLKNSSLGFVWGSIKCNRLKFWDWQLYNISFPHKNLVSFIHSDLVLCSSIRCFNFFVLIHFLRHFIVFVALVYGSFFKKSHFLFGFCNYSVKYNVFNYIVLFLASSISFLLSLRILLNLIVNIMAYLNINSLLSFKL